MDSLKPLSIAVILACLAGGIYYSVVDNETNGAIVVLLGILYFLGVPRIVSSAISFRPSAKRPDPI